MKTRTYSGLLAFDTFEERLDYLKLDGVVGGSTFGFDRYINQSFYRSSLWKQARNHVIIRDNGCDLGVKGYEIGAEPLVHHMNPMVPEDIIHGEEWIINPEFLILTTKATHNAIHYGHDSGLPEVAIERKSGDTKLW